MKSFVYCAIVGTAVFASAAAQSCPITPDEFNSFDFSNIMSYCDDSSSVAGCDKCFSGLTMATQSSLKYINVDDSTTFESFGNQVADQLEACGGPLANAVVGDIGQLRAYPLLSFQRQCQFNFEQYGQTAQIVLDWYTNQGIDLLGILNSNGGSSNTNANTN